jgi:hypothetical protein
MEVSCYKTLTETWSLSTSFDRLSVTPTNRVPSLNHCLLQQSGGMGSQNTCDLLWLGWGIHSQLMGL